CGLVLGSLGVRVLLDLTTAGLPRIQEMTRLPALDPWVAGFTIVLSAVTGVLFGLFPAMHLSRTELATSLKESSGRMGGSLSQNRTRNVLVGTEVALAVVLLCGAVLLMRSFVALHN